MILFNRVNSEKNRIKILKEKVNKIEIKRKKCFYDFGFDTYAGCKKSEEKINQDIAFIIDYFCKENDIGMFLLCDGHGIIGEKISYFLKQEIPKNIQKFLTEILSQRQKIDNLSVINSLKEGYNKTKANLNSRFKTECEISGSTCLTSLIVGNILFTANVGDSRAILIKEIEKGNYKVLQISKDHKPEEESEKKRIIESGGRVEQIKLPNGINYGPYRIWYKYDNFPGLAISRSMGDTLSHEIGVISDPGTLIIFKLEIYEQILKPEDKILILGSDGLYEFLSNEEVIKNNFYNFIRLWIFQYKILKKMMQFHYQIY